MGAVVGDSKVDPDPGRVADWLLPGLFCGLRLAAVGEKVLPLPPERDPDPDPRSTPVGVLTPPVEPFALASVGGLPKTACEVTGSFSRSENELPVGRPMNRLWRVSPDK